MTKEQNNINNQNDDQNNQNTINNASETTHPFETNQPSLPQTDKSYKSNAGKQTELENKTISDDINDYLFVTSHRKKKKHTESYHGNSGYINDYPIVKSNNTNLTSKKHKKHKHRHKKRKMKLWKKILLTVVCTILSLLLISVSSIIFLIHRGSSQMSISDISITAPKSEDIIVQNQGESVIYKGNTYELNKNITNILFIGVDKREIATGLVNGQGGQADVLSLISIDTATGKTSIINISRDAMTDVTLYSQSGDFVGTETAQICLSYAYGDGKESSCENTVASVRRLFYNLPIQAYYALDLDGISVLNDSIGGVDVVSPETINIFTEGQSYLLEGDVAEIFVRDRNTEVDDSNNQRMLRQQVYVQSFINKAIDQTKQDWTTPLDLYNASSDYSCTNLNPSKVSYLASVVLKNPSLTLDMTSVPGEVKMGKEYAEFYTNEEAFYDMFINTFYDKIS